MQNWPKVEVLFAEKLHISPIDLDTLDFYRVENIITAYEEQVDEQNKAQKEEQQLQQKEQSQMQQPDYSGFKVPKIEIPKMDIPKL